METKINKLTVSIISLGLLFWLLGIILAPILASSSIKPLSLLSSGLYFLYQPVCHQFAERSFFVDHMPMAVCVRCFAVYLGGWILSIFYLHRSKITMWSIKRYVFLILPTLVDFILEKMQLYSNLDPVRFAAGFLLGIVIFHIFISSIASIEIKSFTRMVIIYLHSVYKKA